jgi:hypothetical protein
MRATAIPRPEQIDNQDLTTWQLVPAESNQERDEYGPWAIVAGEEAYDLYIEIADAAYPKHVAEFILEAVQAHATRLRLTAAFDDIAREREQMRSRPRDADLYELERGRVVAMMAQLGKLAAEAYEAAPAAEAEAEMKRYYEGVTRLAALAVSWLEAIHARYNMPHLANCLQLEDG